MSRRRFRGTVPLALLGAFAAGAVLDGWLRTHGPPAPAKLDSDLVLSAAPSKDVSARENQPAISAGPADARISAAPAPEAAATTGDVPRGRLRVPIDGETIESLKGGFSETRGGNRPHEAVDILAPRNTPIHAVENGTIAKLFTSKAGGLTIYQFDPTGHLCYYYAHLQRYADDLKEGLKVSQGDVIGYVGTTGNAPPSTPHLHFAVFELNADKHWWQGKALDPYLVFKDRG
jgi:murein DD-endopeptidase MepM/ murein hydrolase activator NlpD